MIASLHAGREVVNQLERADPGVVVLDVDMPEMDGLTALPLLLKTRRDLVVIMASTLTRRNTEISLGALTLGATDYIPKPRRQQRGPRRIRLPPRANREDPSSGSARILMQNSLLQCERAIIESGSPVL